MIASFPVTSFGEYLLGANIVHICHHYCGHRHCHVAQICFEGNWLWTHLPKLECKDSPSGLHALAVHADHECNMQGAIYPKLAGHIAHFLAQTLFKTSLIALSTTDYR